MAKRFKGKSVLITGAASGIGAETARRFVKEGANVIVADLQKDAGGALVDELGSASRFMAVDVTHEAHVSAAVDYAVAEFGGLDIMVNNAGVVGAVGSIVDTPVRDFDKSVAILLRGVFLGMKHAARVMIPAGKGSILSLASIAGISGGLGPHVYSAAKAGVIGLTKSVASELSQHGIRVNAVAPGGIASPMTAEVASGDPDNLAAINAGLKAGSPLGFAAQPADIAEALMYLASDVARNVTGHTLVVDAGVTTGAGPSGLTQMDNKFLATDSGSKR